MTRAEKASDATLDEILASIRRIIAEEPEGTRPLPVTKPKAPSLAAEPQRGAARPQPGADGFGSQFSALRPGAAPPTRASAPASSSQPAAPETTARQPQFDDPPLPELSMAGAAAPTPRAPAPSAPLDSAFGRLAEALGGSRRPMPEARPDVSLPPLAPAASSTAEAKPSPAPASLDPLRSAVDDLSDLLDDVAPFAAPLAQPALASGEPVDAPEPAFAAPSEPAPAPVEHARRETGAPRTIARRTVDLGAIVPGRDEPEAEAGPTPDAPAEPVATGLGSRSSSQARAMDKMLSARIASASVKHPAPAPEPTGPVVIASMPDPKPAAPSAGPADEELAGAEADAASVLDMLAAGLAQASPPVPVEAPAAPASPAPSTASANEQPSPTEKPGAPSRPVVSPAAPSLPLAAGVDQPDTAEVPLAAAFSPAVPAPAAPAPAAASTQLQAALPPVVGVRTIEDMVAELLRPMLREWLAENMPRMVEKALRIELAEGLKTVNHVPRKVADK